MFDQMRNIIRLTTDVYLNKFLSKISDDKKPVVIEHYEKDIERITNYFHSTGFLGVDFQLTEDFLKGFHKNLYPEGYIQRKKDAKGREFVWMIPGEYKHLKIISEDWLNPLCSDIPGWDPNREIYTSPANTKKEMEIAIKRFNSEFNNIEGIQEKKDYILFFILDILYIHPFSDGNGRVIKILCDLLFLKIGLDPVGFMHIGEKNKLQLNKSMYRAHFEKDLRFIYEFMEKYEQE